MPSDISQHLAALKNASQAQRAAALLAVDQFGEHVIGDAQQLTPVLTGALQASGTTEPAKSGGEGIEKTIGFNTNYAAAVHEKLNARHAVGQAKFLEEAMKQNSSKFGPFVAGRVKEAGGE